MPVLRQRTNLDELQFWMTTCGCPKPALHYSEEFLARVCQNCGVIITADQSTQSEVVVESHNIDAPLDKSNPFPLPKEIIGGLNQKPSSFVHLRVHTHHSLLRATCKHKDLIKLSKEFGMTALAKTEFGNMCGVPTFVKDCLDAKIKPVVGVEFETMFDTTPYNITFIALNRAGYKQIVGLTTKAWCERKTKKIDPHVLVDDIPTTQDVIALVDIGPNPELAQRLIPQIAKRMSTWIEVNVDDENLFNWARQISAATCCRIVVTGNVLYTKDEDRSAYGVGLKIGKYAHDYHLPEHVNNWFKSPEQFGSFFGYPQEWVDETLKIAELVQDYGLVNKGFIIPTFKDYGKEYTDQEEVHRKLELECWSGLYAKGKSSDLKYQERLQFELQMMKDKKFSSYFLLIGEIVTWMKRNGILVPFGRGSSVGSLVCYCLDIISLDPIKWDIPFERFINKGRKDLPDIDTDISQERRGEVLRHIAEVHGRDRVAHIATFQTLKIRAALENTGRALQVPHVINRDIRREIPEDVVEWDDLHKDNQANIRKHISFKPEWLDIALALTGSAKNLGYHAAGVVVANDPLGELVPLLPPEEEGGLIGIQYDMHDCEVLGLLKLDMLGLRNIDIIDYTLKRIKNRHGVDIDVYNLPDDDKPTYDKIAKANYVSVFQLDSGGYRRLCRQLQPENFHHIMALNALFRPGPLEGGMTTEFVERRHKRQAEIGWHPWLDKVLAPTHQVPVYQEQVMAIARIIAGFDETEADEYRKAIGKKDAVKFEAAQNKFKDRALKVQGLSPPAGFKGSLVEWIDELLHKLEGYARYGWNSGHSAGYGWITYVTAWLETHYQYEYYAALLDAFAGTTKRLPSLLRSILNAKVHIVPPNINESGVTYDVGTNNLIYMGLQAVRNVGKSADEIVVDRKKNGPYSSFISFCQRLPGINATAKKNLVKAGAFSWDTMMCDRDKVDNLDAIQKWVRKDTRKFNGATVSAFEIAMRLEALYGKEYTEIERNNNEREALNSFITGHPAESYQSLAPYLERGNVRVITPSQLNPDEVTLGETVLLVGMVDQINRKMTAANDRYPSRPYLNMMVSDTENAQMINIWYPRCDDLGKILIVNEIAMFECVVNQDRFNPDRYMMKVDTAISLANGLPIKGVFRTNGYDPSDIVKRIGGTPDGIRNMGSRVFSPVRGRISVKPHVLHDILTDCGDDVKYLISMETFDGTTAN